MSAETIYQVSDLAGSRRTDFLDDARRSRALLRDRDGTSLVMLPEKRLRHLEQLDDFVALHLRLDDLLGRPERPSVRDLGDLAWLRPFDRDDLDAFAEELHDALVAARSDGDTSVLDEVMVAWRVTARQLLDPLRRSVLLGRDDDSAFVEVGDPTDRTDEQ